jgi:hypothetical protein
MYGYSCDVKSHYDSVWFCGALRKQIALPDVLVDFAILSLDTSVSGERLWFDKI